METSAATGVSSVAADHTATAAANTGLPPTRSGSQPPSTYHSFGLIETALSENISVFQ